MIPRISKGTSAYGALAYDHGPGRRDEHKNPHKVAGNVPGRTWRERAKAIDSHARAARSEVLKPLHRTSLRISESDRRLSDAEWKQVANEYVQRMGFESCPWEATRHADDHIHITVNRVQWDGKLATTSHDYAKAQAASRHIEKVHGLEDASRKFRRERPEVSKGERESAERRNVLPEREQLREKLSEAERLSNGSRNSYEEKLSELGVNYRANVASTGRVSGYSYGLHGHLASPKGEVANAPEQVWFKGSQLGKDFSWNRTQDRLLKQAQTSVSVQSNSQGMTREEARAEAIRLRAERDQHQDPVRTPRTAAPGSVERHERNRASHPISRAEARAEAGRLAAERERQRNERERSQEREQER